MVCYFGIDVLAGTERAVEPVDSLPMGRGMITGKPHPEGWGSSLILYNRKKLTNIFKIYTYLLLIIIAPCRYFSPSMSPETLYAQTTPHITSVSIMGRLDVIAILEWMKCCPISCKLAGVIVDQ